MLNLDNLQVRQAVDGDAQAVVDLLSDNGMNPYWKNKSQWYHFYRDYPEGSPLSIISE